MANFVKAYCMVTLINDKVIKRYDIVENCKKSGIAAFQSSSPCTKFLGFMYSV